MEKEDMAKDPVKEIKAKLRTSDKVVEAASIILLEGVNRINLHLSYNKVKTSNI